MMEVNKIILGDCIEVMREWPANSIDCCVTSPPYWWLRDYGCNGQIGLEKTPQEFVAKMVAVFAEVHRVLKPEGTCWVNLGDSYAGSGKGSANYPENAKLYKQGTNKGMLGAKAVNLGVPLGLKPKDLCGIPWRVALALQEFGWYLRQDIIWHKPNPMPESVRDRCTKAHEYIFLLSKSARYFYDAEAIKEDSVDEESYTGGGFRAASAIAEANARPHSNTNSLERERCVKAYPTRNKRSVWTVTTKPFSMWNETVRYHRVALDEISDGMMHIMFPSCPSCAGLFAKASNGFYGERAADLLSRISHIYNHPLFSQVPDFEPIQKNHEVEIWLESLGCFVRDCFLSATGRNIESHKMGLFLETNLSCNSFSETFSRIDDKLEQLLFFVLQTHIHGNSILQDEMDVRLLGQIPSRIVDKFSCKSLSNSNCICGFYHKTTEKSSHFATFPPDLIEPCILAGCPKGGIVLDPFMGSGTTALVAAQNARNYIGCELNPEYIKIAQERLRPLYTGVPVKEARAGQMSLLEANNV